jgi:cytochrome c553
MAAAAMGLACLAAHADDIADKAAVCAACHGETGVPTDKTIPVLWGQNEGYIYIELRDMKKGRRKNPQMAQAVADLSRDDMLALAAYFASKPWTNLNQPRATALEQTHFEAMAKSAGCVGCHQEGYKGAGTQPRLAGQSAAYLEKTMLDFRSGARANNSWMTDLLQTYSPADIQEMARVLAGM